ncbi:MAG: hypothetical protein ACOYMG_24990 [Candidatus Methylumidiphilus sp.]
MRGKGLYSQGGNPLPRALSGDSGLFPHGLYVGRATSNRREAWADVYRAPGRTWEKVKSMENTYTIRLSLQPVWATSCLLPADCAGSAWANHGAVCPPYRANARVQRPAPPHKTRKHRGASWRGCAGTVC